MAGIVRLRTKATEFYIIGFLYYANFTDKSILCIDLF
jgi:hypothetical protein